MLWQKYINHILTQNMMHSMIKYLALSVINYGFLYSILYFPRNARNRFESQKKKKQQTVCLFFVRYVIAINLIICCV